MRTRKRKSDADRANRPVTLHRASCFQLLLFLVVILLSAAMVRAGAALGSNAINSEKNTAFPDNWQCSINGGPFAEVTLPKSENLSAGAQITLQNRLPAAQVRGATVLLRTSQQDVEVTVGGTLIYSSRRGDAASPTSAYHFVRLPTDSGGKMITVVLSSPYDNYAGLMSNIYIGSKASNLFFLLHENGLRFIIGFLIFSVGFLLMVVFFFSKGREGKASITNLGAFFVCAGYWVMAESRMLQFAFPYPAALTNSSVFALSLLPVFSGLYYFNAHNKVYRKTGIAVLAVAGAASLAFAVGSVVNPALPVLILPHYLVLLALYLLMLFSSILTESIKAGKLFSTSVRGIVAFGVCALIELALYFSNMKVYHQSSFLTLGLLLCCIFMVADSIQGFSQVYRSAVKVDALSVLAYVDSLTGLQNRTAFLEALSGIEAGGDAAVTIAMYDLNNLKVVNDTKGHLVGDALLRHCAKAIKASLRQEDKVYRIGGDEFVAILRHDADFDSSALEGRLLAVVEKENQKTLSYRLSIAYGFATFSHETDQTLYDTQARADEQMYACKRIQKAGRASAEPGRETNAL